MRANNSLSSSMAHGVTAQTINQAKGQLESVYFSAVKSALSPFGLRSGEAFMHYLRAYQFFFDREKWLQNLLFSVVCLLIPVIGPIVLLGYAFEVIECMHYLGDKNFPDFDFNRFVKYLLRGLWPFLWQMLVVVPLTFLWLAGFFVLIFTTLDFSSPEPDPENLLVVVAISIGTGLLVGFLGSLILVPLMLRAGLSQEFDFVASLAFAWDFLKRVWWELILAQLFLAVTTPLAVLAGLVFCCVGVYPAAVLINFAQFHLHYQLYELYLERDGTPVPPKTATSHR
jgi:hypothetical protein